MLARDLHHQTADLRDTDAVLSFEAWSVNDEVHTVERLDLDNAVGEGEDCFSLSEAFTDRLFGGLADLNEVRVRESALEIADPGV